MSEYKPIDECTSVAELLADPARWTQDAFARNADGGPVMPEDNDASCWCAYGAIVKVHPLKIVVKRWALLQAIGITSLGGWSDAPERTHAEVLEAVRRAGI